MKRVIGLILCAMIIILFIMSTSAAADNTPVTFASAELKTKVTAALGLSSTATVTRDNMLALTELNISNTAITSLSGLEYATNLKRLYAQNSKISETATLSKLTGIEVVNISGVPVSSPNVAWAKDLKSLQQLYIRGLSGSVKLTDLSSLEALNGKLQVLDVADNPITSLTSIGKIKSLTMLDISGTSSTTLSPLESLTGLNVLLASKAKISTVSVPAKLTKLKRLDLNGNSFTDITPLSSLTGLIELNIKDSNVNTAAGSANANTIAAIRSKGTVVTVTTTSMPSSKITSKVYEVDTKRNMISNVAINTSVSKFLSNLTASGGEIQVYSIDNKTRLTTGNVGTGMRVKLISGQTVLQELKIVIYGDVTGDGDITITDLVGVRQHLLEMRTYNDVYVIAGNAAARLKGQATSSEITIADLVAIQQHLLEMVTIK